MELELDRDSRDKNHYLVDYGKYSTRSLKWVFDNDPRFFPKIVRYTKFYSRSKKKYFVILLRRLKQDNPNYNTCLRDQDKIDKVLAWYKSGAKTREVKKKLEEQYSIKRPQALEQISGDAKKKLAIEFEEEKNNLIDLHILRYNRIYEDKIDIDPNTVAPHIRDIVLGESYETALNALIQKEKLLGFHTKNFKLEVNNFFTKKKTLEAPQFDFTTLSFKEKKELRELLSLIRKKDEDSENITVKPLLQSTLTQEEIKDTKQQFDNPISQVVQQIQEVINEDEEESNIIDMVPKDVVRKTSIDIQQSFSNSMAQKILEEFNRTKPKKKK